MKKLPAKANEYIRQRFPDGMVADVKLAKSKTGQLHYLLEVSDNDVTSYLKFDDKGNLLARDLESHYDEDYEEGDFYGKSDDPVI